MFAHNNTDKFNASGGGAIGRSQYFVAPAYGVNYYGANAAIGSAITTGTGRQRRGRLLSLSVFPALPDI